MSLKLLHEPETEDPILSVVNLIDIFLVIIAALLLATAYLCIIPALLCLDCQAWWPAAVVS